MCILSRLFDHTFHEKTVLPHLLAEVGSDFREVDGCMGITVKCGDTNCVFEFIAYKYIGPVPEREENKTVTLADDDDPPDNDHSEQPQFIGRSQSMSSPHQFSASENSGTGLQSPSPNQSLTPGGVYDYGGTQTRPVLQRSKTVDYSPQAREQKQQGKRSLKSAKAPSVSRSVSVTNSSHTEGSSSDSNRRTYARESVSRESDHSNGGTTSLGKMGVAMPISGATAAGNEQRVGDTTRQSHHSDGSSSQRGKQTQRPRLSSSKSPLLSIEEGGTDDENESSLTSPPPVFSDQ